ncbi:hypothetical protein PHMEG_00029039 [Phytophthora megakarya]|uniref:Uncharacterized protein n=1 Tax=Phytophthora megakarya TaxID=4795 RepID=A0A225V476_9STRA|nr:hypothetical protein PHMEG_00029039 [Phytophthora megakarya]
MVRRKKEQHRIKMVIFRQKKNEIRSKLQREHRRLELQMKKFINNQRVDASSCIWTSPPAQQSLLRELIEEKEVLLHQNGALRKEIQRHEAFHQIVENGHEFLLKIESSILPVSSDRGWWVHVGNGAPSFFFHPFVAEEVDDTTDPIYNEYLNGLSDMPTKDFLFGWNVSRQLNSRDNQQTSVLSRMRFTKQLNVSFHKTCMWEQNLRPLLLTPIDWNRNKLDNVSIQVLQEFGDNKCLMLHSIPGLTNLHYMFLSRTVQWCLQDGRRVLGFSMMVTNSNANNRMRDAMEQENVEWLTEGWAYFMITEIDLYTTEVVYEHYVGCENQIHADRFFIQVAQFVYSWEQDVLSPNLLSQTNSTRTL